MSTELLRVAERAKHDLEAGGRHPGAFTPAPDQGVDLSGRFAPAVGDGASVTWRSKGFPRRACQTATAFDLQVAPHTGLGRCETASTEEPSGGNLLARI
jgi:hypothetical protein